MINIPSYVINCAPNIALSTMLAIVKTESQGHRLAIGLNHGKHLRYGAKNLPQAIAWVDYLEAHNYDFDIGLAQVNIKNVHKYGYRAHDMLDPCKNLTLAGVILQSNYATAKLNSRNDKEALYKTISAYNTGNYHSGFSNGYVYRVVHNAP
jgi:type IV secretion system protein VirB1